MVLRAREPGPLLNILRPKTKNIPQIISIGRINSPDVASLEDGVNDYFNCLKEFVDNSLGDIYEINKGLVNLLIIKKKWLSKYKPSHRHLKSYLIKFNSL